MSIEFNSMLFETPYRLDRAIAESWLYADGLNDEQEVRRTLATVSPEQLASEVWEAWGFENTGANAGIACGGFPGPGGLNTRGCSESAG